MNWITYAAKIRKEAEKARKQASKALESLGDIIPEERRIMFDPQAAYERAIEEGKQQCMRDIEIGLELMSMFRERSNQLTNQGERWYFITVRPPPDASWGRFKLDWEHWIEKWENKWIEYCYVYEQKGETEDELGKGFHVHCRLLTSAQNYYPSHIHRDLSRIFTYVARQCIDVQPIRNLNKCIDYMSGNKPEEEKLKAVAMDTIWRQTVGLAAEVKKNTRLTIEDIN